MPARRWMIVLALFVAFLLAACLGEKATTAPTHTPESVPTHTRTPLPTQKPTSAPTATTAATATAKAISEPTETPTPISASGEPTMDGVIASLEGLPLDDFYEASYAALLGRDPEHLTDLGLAAAFGLRNDRLNDLSAGYVEDTQRLERAILALLRNYDRNVLLPAEQISYDVYEWELDERVRGHAYTYHDYPIHHFLGSYHDNLIRLFTEIHPVVSVEDAEDYVSRLWAAGDQVEQLLEGLAIREEMGIYPPRYILDMSAGQLRDFLGKRGNSAQSISPRRLIVYTTFRDRLANLGGLAEDKRQALLDEAEQAVETAFVPAYLDLLDHVEHLATVAGDKAGVWKLPDGGAYYAYLLRQQTSTDLTANEIHQLGLDEVARIQAELRAAFAELGYPADVSITDGIARAAKDGGSYSVRTQEDKETLIAAYETLLEEIDGQLDAVFDIHPRTQVAVVGGPWGGYYVPGSTDGSRPGAYHVRIEGSPVPRYNMKTIAYHEAVPGHHFQIAIAQDLDLPTFRRDIFFNGYAEGWALYAERLAWELGMYEDDPHGNIGRLQLELVRAARLVVDTGIHAKQWTPDQARAYLQDEAGGWAHEVERYIVRPAQATGYKVGMLEILSQRQQAQETVGEDFDLRAFHRAILENGSVPLAHLGRVVETSLATGMPTDTPAIKITIVYDNTTFDERLTPEWGFAAWIEVGSQVILFDTGADGPTLLSNMALLGLDPRHIDMIVLSHEHGDHIGGLLDLLDQGIAPPVYGLSTFPEAWVAEVQARTTYIEVSDPVEIVPGVFSTGEMGGRPAEQALVLEGTDGRLVITGCAHPGITNIVARAQEIVPGKVSLLVGGFHLLQDTEAYVRNIAGTLQTMGVQRVTPTHCTGDDAIALFAEIYGPEGYVPGGAGKVFEIGP